MGKAGGGQIAFVELVPAGGAGPIPELVADGAGDCVPVEFNGAL